MDLQKQLDRIREEVMSCFRECLPTIEFRTTLALATVWLGLVVAKADKTKDIEERRRLTDEFVTRSTTIRRGVRMLREQSRQDRKRSEDRVKRALS